MKRNFDDHRLGKFWCDKHWGVIKKSLDDENYINPGVAATGVASALYLKGVDAELVRSTGKACCMVKTLDVKNKKILEGIFERSRQWN